MSLNPTSGFIFYLHVRYLSSVRNRQQLRSESMLAFSFLINAVIIMRLSIALPSSGSG